MRESSSGKVSSVRVGRNFSTACGKNFENENLPHSPLCAVLTPVYSDVRYEWRAEGPPRTI